MTNAQKKETRPNIDQSIDTKEDVLKRVRDFLRSCEKHQGSLEKYREGRLKKSTIEFH